MQTTVGGKEASLVDVTMGISASRTTEKEQHLFFTQPSEET